MPNTLTNLIPFLLEDLDEVSRELVGFIPSVARNSSAERAAVGQAIRIPVSRAGSTVSIAPAMTVPEPTDRTVDYVEMTISRAEAFSFGYTGEEQKSMDNAFGSMVFVRDQFKQGIRALVNYIETDLGTEAASHACRAYGTAGTTPFASGLGDSAQLRKILDDNGAPASGRSLVIDTSAGALLRTNTQLTKANEAGSVMTLRQGELLDLHGFSVKESAGVAYPVIGTGAATGDINTAGYAVGATSITLAAAGSGTIVAGDYVTFASDPNKYLVTTGVADLSAGGTLVIAKPGLKLAISTAGAQTVTVVARSVRNIGFSRDAIQLITRAPELPGGRDLAVDSFMITDPRSGLSFEIRHYDAYRKSRFEVAMAWGYKAIKDEHIAALLG